VKSVVRFVVGFLLFGPVVFPAQAAFTSLYIFGDTVSTTTNGPGGANYYGNRYSNGRVWVEVLAQQQGLTYYSNKNLSYYDHTSSNLLTEVNSFPTPTNATNALFVVWVNDADFYDDITTYTADSNSIATWNNAINQSLTNHFKVITNLYFAKGARTLIMPNAVDMTKVPGFAHLPSADKNFIRQRVIAFNAGFTNTLNRARTNCPAIKIYVPDVFALLDNVVTNAAYYGLTNALDSNGQSIDAVTYFSPLQTLNGPGTNFIFWDYLDPTAKLHSVIADVVQQLISPVRISQLTAFNGSNRLDMANVPIGQNGLVIGRTNLVLGNWKTNATFVSSNVTQSVFVTPSGPQWFYRLKFPYSWTWP
jgi:phospholipase/lecithinase/hemolysin